MVNRLVSLIVIVTLLGSLVGIGTPIVAASATGWSQPKGGCTTDTWPDPIELAEATSTYTPSVIGLNAGSNESEVEELVAAWSYPFQECIENPSPFGCSPAIGDLGLTADLQIVTGSDEIGLRNPLTGEGMAGAWRAFDSRGDMLWIKDTQSDQARGSPVIADLNGDGNLEIATGTTSGRTVEVLDRFGQFVWTFPDPPGHGSNNWHSSPAAADVMPEVSGLEVFIGNRPLNMLFALKGAPDGIDDGVSAADIDWPPGVTGEDITGWEGVEGRDWDLLWVFETNGSIMSTPAIGDVTGAGNYVVVFGAGSEFGSPDGKVYMLEADTGKLLWSFQTGGSFVQSSPALADFDGDGRLDMVVVGSSDGGVYFIEIPDLLQSEATFGKVQASPTIVSTFYTGAPVHSSPALGDVDGDGYLEVIIGSTNGNVYSLSYDLTSNKITRNWTFHTDGPIVSSPALANRGHGRLDAYIGSFDHGLYLLNGITGERIARFDSGQPVKTSPAVADVDGDGHLDVFFTSGGDLPEEWRSVSCTSTFWSLKDIGSEVTAYAVEWPMFRHNPERTGVYTEIALAEYTLVVGSTAGGSVIAPGEGSFTYNHRVVINLVATPASGYRFSHWAGDVSSLANVNAASTTIGIKGNYSITATFARIPVYDLAVGSTAGGSVDSPGEGAFSYEEGTVVSLVATPTSGYRFSHWTGDVSSIANVKAASTTIHMNGDYSVTANFLRMCRLTISTTRGGSISSPGEGSFVYDEGTVVRLVAQAEELYEFAGWTGDVASIRDIRAASTTITMNDDYSVAAAFTVGGCFIATAAYGTPMVEEVQILREFRDGYLLNNLFGRALVDFYYSISPPTAEFISEHPTLKPIVRAALVPAVAMSTVAVNTTPAEKAAAIGLLAMISAVASVWAVRRRHTGPVHV